MKIAGLEAYADELAAKNDAVITTLVQLNQARARRDDLIYSTDNSVVNTALLVKAYVKGAFGASSPIYKQLRGLQFKTRGARR